MALWMQWYRQGLIRYQSPKVKSAAKAIKTKQTTKMKLKVRLENAAGRERAMKRVVAKYTGSI